MKNILFVLCAAAITLSSSTCNSTKRTSKSNDANDAQQQAVNSDADQNLVEKYWKLIELYGNPVTPANNKEAHITFHSEDNRFSGDAGCNLFSGSYQIQNNYRITFSQTMATQMMCIDMDTETKFLQAIEMADSYVVNGDTMALNRARMAPLARFVAVYLR